jgi:Holliday junction resolvase-like predicted endonuclease
MAILIKKTTGELEEFSPEKLVCSLTDAGATRPVAEDVAKKVIAQHPTSTDKVHDLAYSQLKRRHRPLAARYDLKRALLKLGPSGYPFERYVGELLREKGYKVQVNQVLRGRCVTHEVDVIAEKEGHRHLIECKFHNDLGSKSDVKVPLYIKARFDDLDEYWNAIHEEPTLQHMWIVTNTAFTSDAIQYSRCVGRPTTPIERAGIHLVGWDYPAGQGLGRMIDETGLHPVTALASLTPKAKDRLVREGVVLCRDLAGNARALRSVGIRGRQADDLQREAEMVCSLR